MGKVISFTCLNKCKLYYFQKIDFIQKILIYFLSLIFGKIRGNFVAFSLSCALILFSYSFYRDLVKKFCARLNRTW